ncbi:MAG TPA: hypothetical protein VG146_06975 [Verrucomicrobiae bacterium]|nr:hypothetical protein [Verrucomicrobiae bacterium]
MGKSPAEADIPHRNFIPKQLEPVPPPTPEPLPMQEMLKMQLDSLRRRSAPPEPVNPTP